jgi:hypothetical protein
MHKKPNEQSPVVEQTDQTSVLQPIMDHLKNPHKPEEKLEEKPEEKAPPVGPIHPPQSAELDQDPGGGYNANHVVPQP